MSDLAQEDKWVEKKWTLGERFGANVVWFRSKAGLSQEALGERVGMNRVAIGELERGRRLPRLDTILKLAAGSVFRLAISSPGCGGTPPVMSHFDSPADAGSGHEVWDFDLPARFRVSPVGYESKERFKDRLRQRIEDPDHRAVLELLRDDAPEVAPRPRPDAAWVLRTGQALKALREERGLTQQQLAKRARTTATFIGEIEQGRVFDPGLWILTEICRALDGEGSELSAQIEPVRAERKVAVQKVLAELAERDGRQAEG
jgi:transcriptional regulator with XRE-family HTH domain